MAFADLTDQPQAVELLQRSLQRGRLAHAYLFTGDDLDRLEVMARTLAKTLNCEPPPGRTQGPEGADCCDACSSCRRIEAFLHPDVLWVRPESKLRVITIDQIRDLMQTVNLKPKEARWKVAVIVAADRLNVQAANAFLKTLEEPPPNSVLVLLATEPQRLLQTVRSRCLRLNLAGGSRQHLTAADRQWLTGFAEAAASCAAGPLARYRLLGTVLARLAEIKSGVEQTLTARSPLERYEEVDPRLREKWEEELSAAIEAEYRHQRTGLLAGLQCYFRDVWLKTLGMSDDQLALPDAKRWAAETARRIPAQAAFENLQLLERSRRLLDTSIQEALVLEVGFLTLRL